MPRISSSRRSMMSSDKWSKTALSNRLLTGSSRQSSILANRSRSRASGRCRDSRNRSQSNKICRQATTLLEGSSKTRIKMLISTLSEVLSLVLGHVHLQKAYIGLKMWLFSKDLSYKEIDSTFKIEVLSI